MLSLLEKLADIGDAQIYIFSNPEEPYKKKKKHSAFTKLRVLHILQNAIMQTIRGVTVGNSLPGFSYFLSCIMKNRCERAHNHGINQALSSQNPTHFSSAHPKKEERKLEMPV